MPASSKIPSATSVSFIVIRLFENHKITFLGQSNKNEKNQ